MDASSDSRSGISLATCCSLAAGANLHYLRTERPITTRKSHRGHANRNVRMHAWGDPWRAPATAYQARHGTYRGAVSACGS
jgi:hypothetical protein